MLFKNKYRIESARLKNWDYSWNGSYFVTICIKDRECCFGNVVGEEMMLSDMGIITDRIWKLIPDKFYYVELDKFVTMPNHVHGIIIIDNENNDDCRDLINQISTGDKKIPHPMGSGSLGEIIRWFKGRCTYEINKKFDQNNFVWQPGYYDRIIRNEKEFGNVQQYIIDNPRKWEEDRNNIDNL